ncbi:integral membrane protein [Xylariomycetidae sp. FL2044]|nr:integral membrane protein [Xylariomycetidae sp. FL2044]
MTSSPLLHGPRARRRKGPLLDESIIPPVLRPMVRAYVLGYASAVAPRVLTLVLQHVTRRRRKGDEPHDPFVVSLQRILRGGLDVQRFPTFCAALVGGTTILEPWRAGAPSSRLSRWLSSFVAAWLSLRLLQSKKSDGLSETIAVNGDTASSSTTATFSNTSSKPQTIRYAGRTLDLTLFALTRALDVIIGELWARRKQRCLSAVSSGQWTWLETLISRLTDPAIFATSCALVMWSWFYRPTTLPRAYQKWISSAAAVDPRLIEALRRCRSGDLVYGRDDAGPEARLLEPMCADYGLPPSWGDPAVAVPFPCELVHMGSGPSCEFHALSRLARSFRWSYAMYLPLNLLARRPRTLAGLRAALLSAARSSAFLSSFIMLFYYGVCLARTRLGPPLLGTGARARQALDGGLCVGCGCLLCGWSILLEKAARRKDMALFVAPRALATLLPRRYAAAKQWRETLVFALSTAVVFTCVRENPKRVRGVLGGVLRSVLEG